MRLCAITRTLPVAAIEVVAPCWTVRPHSFRVVAELGFLASAIADLAAAGLAGHFDRR